METKEKMKAARNEKSVVSVKAKVDFLDTEGNKSFLVRGVEMARLPKQTNQIALRFASNARWQACLDLDWERNESKWHLHALRMWAIFGPYGCRCWNPWS